MASIGAIFNSTPVKGVSQQPVYSVTLLINSVVCKKHTEIINCKFLMNGIRLPTGIWVIVTFWWNSINKYINTITIENSFTYRALMDSIASILAFICDNKIIYNYSACKSTNRMIVSAFNSFNVVRWIYDAIIMFPFNCSPFSNVANCTV